MEVSNAFGRIHHGQFGTVLMAGMQIALDLLQRDPGLWRQTSRDATHDAKEVRQRCGFAHFRQQAAAGQFNQLCPYGQNLTSEGVAADRDLGGPDQEVDNNEVIQYANQSFCDVSGYEIDELIGKEPERDYQVMGEYEYKSAVEEIENAIRLLKLTDEEFVNTSTYKSVAKYI